MDLPMITKRRCDTAASTGGGTTIREISNSIALGADGRINGGKALNPILFNHGAEFQNWQVDGERRNSFIN
jgi:hypothetical protein